MDEHGNNMQEVSICDSSMNSSLFVKKAKLSKYCKLQVRTLTRRNGTNGKVIKRLYIQDHFNNNNNNTSTQQQQQQQQQQH
ncbi:hypothetical protein V1477_020596 [Vespula maculifrons]|uniref:Uncharacterized protein n=1 Tax=Vespula maculifrons TaxID=7453 RepID=A0ABD2AMZ0_VESMC